jgi:hypothetical protein
VAVEVSLGAGDGVVKLIEKVRVSFWLALVAKRLAVGGQSTAPPPSAVRDRHRHVAGEYVGVQEREQPAHVRTVVCDDDPRRSIVFSANLSVECAGIIHHFCAI